MEYSYKQIAEIKTKIIGKIDKELNIANKEGNIQEVLDKYGIIFEEEAMPVDTRTMKILVFGALAGNLKDYQLAAKKMGISLKNIDFECDYNKLSNYNVARLENSMEYSDIICGPMPHSISGKGDYSSFLAEVESNPSRFPRVIKANSNDSLKITISNFKDALFKTRYCDNLDE